MSKITFLWWSASTTRPPASARERSRGFLWDLFRRGRPPEKNDYGHKRACVWQPCSTRTAHNDPGRSRSRPMQEDPRTQNKWLDATTGHPQRSPSLNFGEISGFTLRNCNKEVVRASETRGIFVTLCLPPKKKDFQFSDLKKSATQPREFFENRHVGLGTPWHHPPKLTKSRSFPKNPDFD